MKKILILFFLFVVSSANAVGPSLPGVVPKVQAPAKLSPELKLGYEKAQQICSTCHGLDGQAASAGSSAVIPNITAQNKDYLIKRLKEYKTGEMKHEQMSVVASMLSEQDISAVAEWYSRIKISISQPSIADPTKAIDKPNP